MRISDWSSDVCSSDLQRGTAQLSACSMPVDRFGPGHSGRALSRPCLDGSSPGGRPLSWLDCQRDGSGYFCQGAGDCPCTPPILCSIASRSEEHTSELQSLMRISYAVFCLKKKKTQRHNKEQEH